MNELHDTHIDCPYCGESINVLVDPSEAGHSYIEDCQVCCQPIVFLVHGDPHGDLYLEVRREDE